MYDRKHNRISRSQQSTAPQLSLSQFNESELQLPKESSSSTTNPTEVEETTNYNKPELKIIKFARTSYQVIKAQFTKNFMVWISLLFVLVSAIVILIWCSNMVAKIIGIVICVIIVLICIIVWYVQYMDAVQKER